MDILYQNIDSYMRYKQHDNIVLIPIGCIENHGHLPLGTDTLIARRFSEDITNNVDNIIKSPILSYGCHSLPDSGGGFHITGTICMDNIQFTLHLEKIVQEFYNNGHVNFIFLNCHFENSPYILDVITRFYKKHENIKDKPNIKMLHLCYWDIQSEDILNKLLPTNYNPKKEHAGVLETSLMMYLYPKIKIKLDNIKIKNSNQNNYDMFNFDKITKEKENCKYSVLSSPIGSSSKKGGILYKDCLNNIIKIINKEFNSRL